MLFLLQFSLLFDKLTVSNYVIYYSKGVVFLETVLRKGQQKVLDDKRFLKLPEVYQEVLRDSSYPVTYYPKFLSYFVRCESAGVDSDLAMERFFWFLSQKFPPPIFLECFELLVVRYLDHSVEVSYLDPYVSLIQTFSREMIWRLIRCYYFLGNSDVSCDTVFEFVTYVFAYNPKVIYSLLVFFQNGLCEGYTVQELKGVADELLVDEECCAEAVPDFGEALEEHLRQLSDVLEPYRSLLGVSYSEWRDVPGTGFDEPLFFDQMKMLGVSSGSITFPFWFYSYNWFHLGQRGVGLRFRKTHTISFQIGKSECTYKCCKPVHDLMIYVFVDGSVSYKCDGMPRAVPLTLKALVSYYDSGDAYFERFLHLLFARFSDGMQKDLWRVMRSGMFLPPMLLSDLEGRESLAQAFTSCYPKVKGNAKKYDINLLYVCDVVSRYVDDRSQRVLAEFRDETFLQRAGITNKTSFRGKCSTGVSLFLQQWYLDRLAGQVSDSLIQEVVLDYHRLCRDLKRPVCLLFMSYRKLYECHMDLSVIYQEKYVPLVKVPKGSVFLSLRQRLPDLFVWIRSRQRLIQESVWQHNCVSSYAPMINRDTCAIYSCVWKDVRYTFSFLLENGQYVIEQAHGPCNTECPQELVDYVRFFL